MDEKAKKEAAVDEKMRLIRKRDEERLKRLKEIEEDMANADVYSDQVARKRAGNPQMIGVRKEGAPVTAHFHRGRGRLLSKMSSESLRAKELEEKRRRNFEKEEEELKRGRGQNSTSGFLADDRRLDMGKTTGRSPHSWGGTHFDGAVNKMGREKDHLRYRGNNPEISMTGKERRNYQEWKEERRKVDASRKERQKKEGNWSREWDQKKEWDSKKGIWMDSNSPTDRRNKPARMDAVDSWGEDTQEKVWDGTNRRWVDPSEAVSFVDTEGQNEDWGKITHVSKTTRSEAANRERKQRNSSSSEGSGVDASGHKSPRHQREKARGFRKSDESEVKKSSADTPAHEARSTGQTQAPVSEDWEDDLLESATQTAENKGSIPADAKPQRKHGRRRIHSSGGKTESGAKEAKEPVEAAASAKEKDGDHNDTLEQHLHIEESGVTDEHCQETSAQESHYGNENVETVCQQQGNNTSGNEQQEIAAKEEEAKQRKDSIDFVPFSPISKESIHVDNWGDVEIDEEEIFDTEIRMVTQ